MPGLTLDTEQRIGVQQTPVPVPIIPTSHAAAQATTAAPSTSAPTTHRPGPSTARTSATPVPMPILPAQASVPLQTPAVPAPISTSSVAQAHAPAQTTVAPIETSRDRSSSPQRPPYSPITPPLNPIQFPPPRQTYAHSSQATATATAPPPPEPIDFDANPDVLALKSAISLLQMQSAKARRDMVALQSAKTAALDDPEAFVADLASGRVTVRNGELRSAGGIDASSSDEDSDDESGTNGASGAKTEPRSPGEGKSRVKSDPDAMSLDEPKPWATLPTQQNVYRCPPINWSQYAVAGESLDRLHNEQVSRPAQGVPAAINADGRYDVKTAPGKQQDFIGIAAPYDPLRDKLPEKKKPKSSNR